MTKQTPIDYSILPPHMQYSTEAYVERGYPPGDFLCAILRNDLLDAAGRADMQNLPKLHIWATWLYNNAPSACHGSKHKIEEWIASGGLEGREKAAAVRPYKIITCEHDLDTETDRCKKCGEDFTIHMLQKGAVL